MSYCDKIQNKTYQNLKYPQINKICLKPVVSKPRKFIKNRNLLVQQRTHARFLLRLSCNIMFKITLEFEKLKSSFLTWQNRQNFVFRTLSQEACAKVIFRSYHKFKDYASFFAVFKAMLYKVR